MPDEQPPQHQNVATFASLLASYGPFSFSIVALLCIWLFIVRPELERRAINFDRQQQVVDVMIDITQTQEKTAESLKTTAQILERLLERADRGQRSE